MTVVYLLLWMYCAVGPADHVVILPDWSPCETLALTLRTDGLTTECRNPEWASIVAADDGCGVGW